MYLNVLPLDAIKTAPEDRVATAAAAVMFGPAAVQLMAAAIMVSTFGCVNGLILAGARVYYTMARDGLFFKRVGTLDPRASRSGDLARDPVRLGGTADAERARTAICSTMLSLQFCCFTC